MDFSNVRVAIAGASGYLGRYIVQECIDRKIKTKILVRDRRKVNDIEEKVETVEAFVTKPETLKNVFDNIDVVISTVGITRQKDGLTYIDVDYQANVNLLNEAKLSGVKKFIYISVLNGDKLKHTKICEAKEKFCDYLRKSELEYCIIRPNGFFSDMGDFLRMAKSGKVFLFGDGNLKLNPIHGKDLAKIVVDTINKDEIELDVGGPDLLSQNEIARLALSAYDKPVKIVHLPDWIRKFILLMLRTFTSSKIYGPIEFFMTTMVIDMEAPQYGENTLEAYFNENAI